MLARSLDRLIRAYQRSGGSLRWFGIRCNFEPSCSEYTRQAIARFGSRRGLALGLARIRRCRDPDCPEPVPDPLPATASRSRNHS